MSIGTEFAVASSDTLELHNVELELCDHIGGEDVIIKILEEEKGDFIYKGVHGVSSDVGSRDIKRKYARSEYAMLGQGSVSNLLDTAVLLHAQKSGLMWGLAKLAYLMTMGYDLELGDWVHN